MQYLLDSEFNYISEKKFSSLLSLTPIIFDTDSKYILKSRNSEIASIHKNEIEETEKKGIEILKAEVKEKKKKHNSENTDSSNLTELLYRYNKLLIIVTSRNDRANLLRSKIIILKKLGKGDECITLLKEIFSNYKVKNYGSEKDKAHFIKLYSSLLTDKGNDLEAIKQLKLAVIIANKTNYVQKKFEVYHLLASIYFRLKNNTVARIYFNKLKKIPKNIRNKDNLSILKLYNLDSIIYHKQKKYLKAIEVILEQLEVAKEMKKNEKIYTT